MFLNPTQVYNKCSKAVLKIISYDKDGLETTGSAIVIKSKGVVVTNFHILRKSSSFKLYGGRNLVEYKRILVSSKKDDLLIFQLKDSKNFPDIGISKITNIGDPVFAIGNPLQYKDSITEGIINGKERIVESYDHPMKIRMENLLQISAQISPGNSGGGLFNKEGELIGITTSTDSLGQNINFAIPIESVLKLLKKAPKKAIYQNILLEKEVFKYHLTTINGDYDQALIHINRCLNISKETKYFLYNKIELLIELNRYKEAIKACKKALSKKIDYEILVSLNWALIHAEDRKESLKIALTLFKKYPNNYKLCYSVGFRYLDISRFNKAKIYFNKAKSINRNGVDHLRGLSRMYLLQGKYYKAGLILYRLKKNNPEEYYILYLLSELYHAAKKYISALNYMNEYLDKLSSQKATNIEISLKHESYYQSRSEEYIGMLGKIAIIVDLKEYDEALNEINNMLNSNPNESYLFLLRSRLMLMKNKPEKAFEDVFLSIKLNPNHFNSYYQLAQIYLSTNKPKKALLTINKPLKIVPNSIFYLYMKASILFALKRYPDAIKLCRKILRSNNHHLKSLELLRKYYFEKDNFKTALTYSLKQLEVKPCDWEYLYNTSNILFIMRKYKEAVPYANKSLEWSIDPEVFILRGKLNFVLGEYRAAIKDFSEVEKTDKETVDIYHYRGKAYYKMRMYSLALIDLEKAIVSDSSLEAELWPIILDARKGNNLH